jgi:hypothetical protein
MLKKSHASITAPLKKMLTNLLVYISEQKKEIKKNEMEKAKIDGKIFVSQGEIESSRNTADMLEKMVGKVEVPKK